MNNEQEKAKELAELLTAFADGKQFQIKNTFGKWQDYNGNASISFIDMSYGSLRIKPETKRIALNHKDLIDRELSNKTMRMKIGKEIQLVTKWDEDYIYLDGYKYKYDNLIEYPFLDNSPCYKEVECE